jgi:alcohol dehydrogenase
MDTAKGCNFLLTNGGRMQDYWGVGKATLPMLPLLAVPTTAGTGSECQSAALIADEHSHQKMACLDPKATARIAILDPELTLSLPRQVTAHTGVDALVHALETAVTTRRNPWSLTFSHRAFSLLTALPRVLRQPDDLEARGHMLLGAAYAGMAIESSMLGAAHAAANPLTAHHQITHGVAVGLMIPHVLRFNAADPAAAHAYALLAHQAGLVPNTNDIPRALDCLQAAVQQLLNCAGVLSPLTAHGVTATDLTLLADEAARQWTAQFNPRPLHTKDFLNLYQAALHTPGNAA